jgi:hypothetical protein
MGYELFIRKNNYNKSNKRRIRVLLNKNRNLIRLLYFIDPLFIFYYGFIKYDWALKSDSAPPRESA